jgi:hypothetical protein
MLRHILSQQIIFTLNYIDYYETFRITFNGCGVG